MIIAHRLSSIEHAIRSSLHKADERDRTHAALMARKGPTRLYQLQYGKPRTESLRYEVIQSLIKAEALMAVRLFQWLNSNDLMTKSIRVDKRGLSYIGVRFYGRKGRSISNGQPFESRA
jgi:hypothetical protein